MDRNASPLFLCQAASKSLSARRAWIEILVMALGAVTHLVALRKESVDRNKEDDMELKDTVKSLSARRAWIEISYGALEGASEISRSPQGERG